MLFSSSPQQRSHLKHIPKDFILSTLLPLELTKKAAACLSRRQPFPMSVWHSELCCGRHYFSTSGLALCQILIVGDSILLLNAEYESEGMLVKPGTDPDNKGRLSHTGRTGLTLLCRAVVSSEAWDHVSASNMKCSSATPAHSSPGWAVRDTQTCVLASVGVMASSPAS